MPDTPAVPDVPVGIDVPAASGADVTIGAAGTAYAAQLANGVGVAGGAGAATATDAALGAAVGVVREPASLPAAVVRQGGVAAPADAEGRLSGVAVTVVGIGADGWAGLAPASRAAVRGAAVLFGADRQLDLVPASDGGGSIGGRRVRWPSQLLPALPGLLAEHARRVGTEDAGRDSGPAGLCVLASGDPMFFGIGTTLVRLLGPERVRVLPHPSSVSLVCARLGWALEDVEVISAVGRSLARVHAVLAPGRRLLVLSADRTTPAAVAALLVERGYGASPLTVLGQLGGPDEALHHGLARDWVTGANGTAGVGGATGVGTVGARGVLADLNVVAVEAVPEPGARHLPRTPGLPDDAFEHDGQITKREIRAVTLARLGPVPGELLWDVGAGSGSIGIEWMRTHDTCRAVAVEPRADRAERIRRNAEALGVPGLRVAVGRAPQALAGLPAPDAVFVGGGVTTPGLLDACWAALGGRGRLVVNAVTLESEAVLAAWYARWGGELVRLSVSRAAPVGGFTGWRPAMSVTQWTVWPAVAGGRS